MSSTATPNGILLIDKEQGFTSHDVVAKVRKIAGTRKVGHAGTLDPMATGLLLLGLGASTRLLTYIVGLDKEYIATIRLGASTTTDDAEGEILGWVPHSQLARVEDEHITQGALHLTGEIEQVPSKFSAIKVGGKRAYSLAREGQDVELAARKVLISAFDIQGIFRGETPTGEHFIDVDVRVECSSGTYIRALARDLGFSLGVGGHLTALRRTRIGQFHVSDAFEIDGLSGVQDLMSPADAVRKICPTILVNSTQARELSQGKVITVDGQPNTPGPLAVIDPADRLIGLISVKKERSRILVNFPVESDLATT